MCTIYSNANLGILILSNADVLNSRTNIDDTVGVFATLFSVLNCNSLRTDSKRRVYGEHSASTIFGMLGRKPDFVLVLYDVPIGSAWRSQNKDGGLIVTTTR